MKTAVYYFTKTGNTRKVAEAMAEALGNHAIMVSEGTAAPEAQCVFIGGAVYATADHDIVPQLKNWIRTLDPGKISRAVVFGTGFPTSQALEILRSLLEAKGVKVEKENFFCPGGFLFFNWGRPDKDDLAKAKEFALKMRG